jgi:hypothetical protein
LEWKKIMRRKRDQVFRRIADKLATAPAKTAN